MRYFIQSCAFIYLFAIHDGVLSFHFTDSRPGEDISYEDGVAETGQMNNRDGDESVGEGRDVGQYPLISPETGRNERMEDAANYFEDEDYLKGANLNQPETLEEEEEKRTLRKLEEDAGEDDQDSKLQERIVDGELEQSEKEVDSDWENNFESLGKAAESQIDDDDSSLLDGDVDSEEYDELKWLEKDSVDSEGDEDYTESHSEKVAGALKSSNDGDRDRMSSVKRKLSQTNVRAM